MSESTGPGGQTKLLIASSSIIFLAMVASFAPTPLYPIYQELWHLTNAQVSLAFSMYPAGVLFVLFFLGGLSDKKGRKFVLILGTVLFAVALIVLATAPSFTALALGRLLHGLATGLISGASASAMMESHPKGLNAGAFLNTVSLSAGLAAGPLFAGFITGISKSPLAIPYLAILLGLLLPLSLLVLIKNNTPLNASRSILKPIAVPREILIPFTISTATIATANLSMSLFGSFGSEIARSIGWTSPLSTGLLVALVMFMLATSQILGNIFVYQKVIIFGVSGALLGMGTIYLGTVLASPVLVVSGAVLSGAASGFCLLGSAKHIAAISPPEIRAEVYSAYLIVAFAVLGGTALLSGFVTTKLGIQGTVGSVALIISALLSWVILQRKKLPRAS